MSEWRETTLGEVLTLQRGFDLPARERIEGPYPIVSSSGVTGYHAVAKVDPPGVVIGRYGSLGSVHWLTEPYWPHNTALWVKDFKGNDPRYTSYLLRTISHDGSAAAAVPGVNRNHLHALSVHVPDVATQRRIAAVLTAFDDHISTNERRIVLLEALARSLYREWFVRDGAAHRAGATAPLFDVAEVGFGFSFKSPRFGAEGPHAVVRIRDVPNGSTSTFTDESAPDRYAVRDGDVLIGMDGDFHLNRWSGGEAWLNQRVARLRPAGEISAHHLMQALAEPIEELNRSITGTTVAHLGKRHLEQIVIPVAAPSEAVAVRSAFDKIGDTVLVLRKQCRALASLRDLLLPRLVTGRLDVSDVDLGDLLAVEAT